KPPWQGEAICASPLLGIQYEQMVYSLSGIRLRILPRSLELGNLINPDNAGKRRDRYLKATVLAMRELVGKKKVDDEVRDLTAFIVLTLKQIDETIDETCTAWEKRDYWIKADRFRNDWFWTKTAEGKLHQAVMENKWNLVPAVVK